MKGWFQVAGRVLMGLLLMAGPVAAQVKFGDLSTHLSGTVSPGYSADYGNEIGSDHTWALAGAGTLSGLYYSPNFLSFTASYYLNQSRANSDFQSISNASGVNVSTSIFGGSHFPGSVSYTKAYDSEGNYAVPGLPNYVTHGNSGTFGVNWSENLPNAPSFSAGFQSGTSQYSVYGVNNQGQNNFDSLNLHSGYKLAGFNIGAYYSDGVAHSVIPELIADQPATETHSGDHATGISVSHLLPMQGSASVGYNRSTWSSTYLGTTSTGTIDLVNAVATVHPVEKLAFTGTVNYSDNLSGQLLQNIVSAGGVVTGLNSSQTSDSTDIMGVVTYSPIARLQTSVFGEIRTQTFLGESYGVDSYGGSATYMRNVLNGTLNGSVTVTENSNDQTGEDTLGFSANGNYSTVADGWHLNGSFGYAQNVETLLVTYMNSFYNYSFNARRAWGEFNMSVGAGASRTGLTEEAGTTSSSQNYNASIGYGRWFSTNGSYAKADGEALLTGAGLTTLPVPPPILPSSLVSLYGGTSYSVGLSSSPVKKLTLSAAYSRSNSNIASDGLMSSNETNQFNTLIQYQTRKLYYTSGYARLQQGFSTTVGPPEIVASYYVGVSRWFNFF
ncbi:MAG TPA: hypothetical protein VHX60_03980 [Acidobacteriaceae bacterium]|nr:hypothetical protein [Acidobacteriaceae bacterium]